MKKQILFLILPFFATASSAQTLVGSAGSEQVSTTIHLSYSVGELATETYVGPVKLTQGFHQADGTITSVSSARPDFDMAVYPNPCVDRLTVTIDETGHYEFEIIDLQGRSVMRRAASNSGMTTLNVSPLNTGMYLLRTRNVDTDEAHALHFQKIN